jgi:HK97 family phage major capsid protein
MDKVLKALEEQKEAIDGNMGEIKSSVSDIETRMTEMENTVSSKFVDMPGVEDEKESFSFLKAFKGIASNDWTDSGFEKEVFDNARKGVQSTQAGSGGYFVPAQFVNEIIELLRAKVAVMQMGATVISDIQGSPLEIPRQTGGASAYWVGENEAITESNITDGQMALTPKSCAGLVKTSMRLVNLANPSMEAMIRNDLAKAIALKIDLAALSGTGSQHQPIGISNTANILTFTQTSTDGSSNTRGFNFSDAAIMVAKVEAQNALEGNLGFIMHPNIKNVMKRERILQFSGDVNGGYVSLPMSDSALSDHLGYKWATTTQIPVNLGGDTDESRVYFGNWSDLIIGQWGGLELMASKETSDAFAKNQLWIRAIQDVDLGVRHPESFCVCSDARVVAD